MKKIAFWASVVFVLLTFAGAGYVLFHRGTVNAGYAVVPMVFALACVEFYRKSQK